MHAHGCTLKPKQREEKKCALARLPHVTASQQQLLIVYLAALALSLYNFFLPDAGCPTNEYSAEAVGMAPLHWAATEGRLRASAWLLGPGGADPEGRDNQVKKRHPPPFVL